MIRHGLFAAGFAVAAVVTVAAASPLHAAIGTAAGKTPPACEAFTDERELRFRTPARTVTGHIEPESVQLDDVPPVEFGQTLVLGRAVLATESRERIPVSFGFWRSNDGCSGWEPARGQNMTFDLADDKQPDGTLRVMRAGTFAGATR